MEVLGPYLPLVQRLGRLATALADGDIARVECEYLGHLASRDTRLLTLATLNGVLAGHTEEEVNLVNAPSLAEERGIEVAETKELVARDFTDLVRITVGGARVVGTTLGQRHRPHLLEAWGQRFNLQLDDAHFALFRYSDLPGMVGRVGTVLRRARHQHLPGRRRPRAPGRGRPPRQRRRHGRHRRRPGARRPSSTRSSPPTASSRAAPSRSRRGHKNRGLITACVRHDAAAPISASSRRWSRGARRRRRRARRPPKAAEPGDARPPRRVDRAGRWSTGRRDTTTPPFRETANITLHADATPAARIAAGADSPDHVEIEPNARATPVAQLGARVPITMTGRCSLAGMQAG